MGHRDAGTYGLRRLVLGFLCLSILSSDCPVKAQEQAASTPPPPLVETNPFADSSLQPIERRARRVDAATLPPTQPVPVRPSPAPRRPSSKTTAGIPAEIITLANELGSPAAILRYVHDTIRFDPKHAADSPPLGTLWERRGTAWDQAWLLQELLRARGVDARLEWGEVEITPDLLTTLAGVDDPVRAADLLTTAGTPVVLVVGGSEVIVARMPHVWVKAHLDYIPNRGLTHGTPDTWLRMDPTLKEHPVVEGQRLDEAVPYVLADHLASGTEQSPRQDYEAALVAEAGTPNLDSFKPLRSLSAENFPFVPGTLRAKVLSVDGESETMPESKQVRLDVTAREPGGDTLFSWSTRLPAIYGEALELRWQGATSADQADLDLYGGIYTTPPYEVELAGELRLGGSTVASGGSIGGAKDLELTATITPSGGAVATTARWDLFAGEHAVLGFDLGHTPQEVVDHFEQRADAATTADDREANQLAAAAATYFQHLGDDLEHLGALRWHRVVPLATAVLAVQRGAVSTFPNGSPETFSRGPLSLDLGAMPLGIFPADGTAVELRPTIELLGSQASVREGEALATVFGGEHPTAVGFLKQAVREGQEFIRVDTGNLEATLTDAELGDDAEAAVRDAVERGLLAWVAERQIEINGWQTSGYILQEPGTGFGGYHVAFERRLSALDGAVTFHAPQDLDVVTAPTDVIATLDAEGLQSWTLSTRPVGSSNGTILATGTGPVENTTLGEFDPTLLLNGLHELILTGTDAAGQTVSGKVAVSVEGNMKIGHFTLSFVDLAIPVSGLDIEVVRTYDSRQRLEQGDFGQGWTLDIRQGSYCNNRPPGDGWQIPGTEGPWGLPCSTVHETKSHLTTVRLSDQEVYRFRLALRNPATVIGGCFADAVFEWVDGPLPGTTLEVLGTSQVFVATGSDRAVLPDTQEPFVPEDVKLTTRDGRIFHLDLADGVTHVEDLNGNFLEITPEGITHSSGKGIEFERDEAGRIVTITDPMGNSNRYDYDEAGDLVSFTDRVDAVTRFTYTGEHYLADIENALGVRAVRTEYDEDGRVARMIDADGKVVALDHDLEGRREVITNRLGFVRVLEYDERGNVVREVDELGNTTLRTFDADDRLLSLTDPLGNTTTNSYDAVGDLIAITDPLGHVTRLAYDPRGNPTSITDALGQVSTFTHDARGNLIEAMDPLGAVTAFAYDTRGLLLTETDALGQVSAYGYDGDGLPTTVTDPLGVTTTTTFDALGNPIRRSSPRTLGDGTVEEVVSTFEVDALGRVVASTAPTGSTTTFAYDALGNLLTSTDALGRTTTHTYDGRGQLTDIAYPDGTSDARLYDAEGRLTAVVDRAGRTTTFGYDAAGRRIETILPDGASRRNTYDAAGRLLASADALGHATTHVYDAAGRRIASTDPLGSTTATTVDAVGNVVAVTDALGVTTGFVYDAVGRLLSTVLPDGSGSVTEYDALGRPISEIDAGEVDAAGLRTAFTYDALGRLVTVTDALGGTTRYGYDELGNRTHQTDANGHTTRFEHDALGRQIARTLPDGATERFVYDAVGNRIARTDFGGATTTYIYDALDRLSQRLQTDGTTVDFSYTATGRRAAMTDPRGTTTYTYDARDRRVATTTPEGWVLRNAWDAEGRRTGLTLDLGDPAEGGLGVYTTTYAYDGTGRLTTVTDARGGVSSYGYDALGRQVSLVQSNGVTTTRTYNPAGRLLGLTTIDPAGDVLQSFDYTLGSTGRRKSVQEHDGTVRAWSYDALHRLTAERVTDGAGALVHEHRFTYDPVGNRLTQEREDGDGSLERIESLFDDRDRMLSETVGGVATTYGWDSNGNRISKTATEGTTTYSWDSENRLAQVGLPDGTTVTNLYDGDGFWVGRTLQPPGESAETRSFLVDTTEALSQVVAEIEGGSLASQYARGDRLLAILNDDGESAVHADGLGSVRTVSDPAGVVASRTDYEAFGAVARQVGSAISPFGFAGEYRDATIGLAHHRARWMDPGVGRFVSMDPFVGNRRAPVSLHRYQYADLDPTLRVDPTGLFTAGESLVVNVVRAEITAIQVDIFIESLRSTKFGKDPKLRAIFEVYDTIRSALAITAVVGGVLYAARSIGGRLIRSTRPNFDPDAKFVVDLFGGPSSQVPGALNVDKIAQQGVRGDVGQLPFRASSVDEIVASGPRAAFLEEAARVLKPGGRVYINFTRRNQFGQIPSPADLERLGLKIVREAGPLDSKFSGQKFFFSDGTTEIPPEKLLTTVLEKVQ